MGRTPPRFLYSLSALSWQYIALYIEDGEPSLDAEGNWLVPQHYTKVVKSKIKCVSWFFNV